MKAARIPVENIDPDPENRVIDKDGLPPLGKNMLAIGQQVPAIVFPVGGRHQLADGERRWLAAKLVGIPDLLVVVLTSKPDAKQLRLTKLSLEVHKVAHSPIERSDLLAKLRDEDGMTVGEIAEQVQMSQPLVSKLLSFQKLGPDIRALLHTGRIDLEKAYAISGEPDVQKQAALLKECATLTRDQVRSRVRKKVIDQPRAKRAVFALPGGMSITFQGPEVTLGDVAEHFANLAKVLRRGEAEGLDIRTQQSVMRDKAKQLVTVAS